MTWDYEELRRLCSAKGLPDSTESVALQGGVALSWRIYSGLL